MRCTIAGQSFYLHPSDIERLMANVDPESIKGHFVEIGHRRYPVKQVGALVSGQHPADFTAAEVRTALTRLGFTCGTVA